MQQFFHINQPQQSQNNMTPELQNNLIVLEICNNWEFVTDLYFKMMSGNLTKVDTLETSWISYINSNNLNIDNYKDADDFQNKHLRALTAEQMNKLK